MTYDELAEAKIVGHWALTYEGKGMIDSIGHKQTYIFFADSPDGVTGRLILFDNDEIKDGGPGAPVPKRWPALGV